MCLAVFALDVHPRFAVVIIANRDEFHARPTEAAAWWPEGILAGRDLRAGGTWLGIHRNGRFALLTNVRNPARHDPSRASRGALVASVLGDPPSVDGALERAAADAERYNGFNLLAGDAREASWLSNQPSAMRRLPAGIYGLSNAQLDVPWPKLTRSRDVLAQWIAQGDVDPEPLFTALADRTLAADHELPSTGVTLARERQLSAAFIVGTDYGTRSSTLITIDRSGHVDFVERSFDASAVLAGEHAYRFTLG